MTPLETVLPFDCVGERLLGILHPSAHPTTLGVVLIVGGPQYRAGSHRQFVQLARAVAAAGHPVLRFDCRGMGDSGGAQRDFEHLSDDIGAAIDALLRHQSDVQHVVLWGLCDAAAAALLYLHERPDPRVAGLALLNPWLRSQASLAATHVKHYYLKRLTERAFWRKLLGGQMAWGAVRGLLQNLQLTLRGGTDSTAVAPFQQRMAQAWEAFDGPILLMLSEHDHTAQEFTEHSRSSPAWQRARLRRPHAAVRIAGADHTCSLPGTKQQAERLTVDWLAGITPNRIEP